MDYILLTKKVHKLLGATLAISKKLDTNQLLDLAFYAKQLVTNLFIEIKYQVLKGNKVTIPEFGTFICKEIEAKEGVTPKGVKWNKPKRKVVTFIPDE